MKALKVLIIILALFCGAAYLLPKDIVVSRTIKINTSVEAAYEQANTLNNWANWSAWHAADTNAVYTYSNPDSGAGASYSWIGDPELVGEGKLTILESVTNKSMRTEVIFYKEGEENGRGNGEWTFTEDNGATTVSWAFLGDLGYNPVARWFGLFMDSMLGPQLETGLNNMKNYLESLPEEIEELTADSVSIE
ncbi:MAG: SRPBCC family protein [Bacteroidetes bacterium]|nr:SRPBCC family protein [Bacteroidota bacterium]